MSKLKLTITIILAVFIISQSSSFTSAQTEAEKQGKEIYEKYQAALGGKENFDKVKTSEIIAETERYGAKGKQTEIKDLAKNKSYTLQEGNDGKKREVGSDGSRIWVRSNESSGYLNLPISNDSTPKRTKLPNETLNGKEYLVVQITVSDLATENKEYYDPKTFLLAHTLGSFMQINGQPTETMTSFSDYRKVGDIMVPFSEVTNNYFGTISKKIVSVKHNIEVDQDIFELEPKKKDTPKVASK